MLTGACGIWRLPGFAGLFLYTIAVGSAGSTPAPDPGAGDHSTAWQGTVRMAAMPVCDSAPISAILG